MKKIMLTMILMASVYFMYSQVVVVEQDTRMHPAYAAPGRIITSFRTTYPDVTTVVWEPVQTLWRASYRKSNRIVNVYYYPNNDSYSVTLPSLSGYVPEDLITKAIAKYGSSLFDITRMKSVNGADAFKVRLLKDNSLNDYKTIWINANGDEMR